MWLTFSDWLCVSVNSRYTALPLLTLPMYTEAHKDGVKHLGVMVEIMVRMREIIMSVSVLTERNVYVCVCVWAYYKMYVSSEGVESNTSLTCAHFTSQCFASASNPSALCEFYVYVHIHLSLYGSLNTTCTNTFLHLDPSCECKYTHINILSSFPVWLSLLVACAQSLIWPL